ncbi:MAG: permease, partial [Candidatus Marinimicrobia bacterium]|nr:permease [Candidatus Neomarinimicrobiota bacterium]
MKDYVKEKETQRKGMKKDAILLGVTLIITIILLSIFPDKQEAVTTASWKFFFEMTLILPAVVVLMSLFSVFVPKEMVVKYLGKAAGIKAVFLGILMGALPTGPLYVAFPMASALLKKGAQISCIIAFLSAWACI